MLQVHIVVMLIFSVLALLIGCNVVDVNLSCFSVDTSGYLYIGKNGEIEVYEDDRIARTIDPKTSHGYMFTIQDDDTILMSTASLVYSMDLYGNILDSWKDEGTRTYNELQYKRNKFITSSGDVYQLKGKLGWTRIVKNGTFVVYRIPTGTYLVKLGLYIGVIDFIIIVSAFLKRRLEQLRLQVHME